MQQQIKWRVSPTKHNGYTDADLEWLRACGLTVEILPPERISIHDSGWCDAGTGHQILTGRHEIYVTTTTPEQETWVKLYWEERAFEFDTVQFAAINTMNSFLKG